LSKEFKENIYFDNIIYTKISSKEKVEDYQSTDFSEVEINEKT
jgi:hypothetical protein